MRKFPSLTWIKSIFSEDRKFSSSESAKSVSAASDNIRDFCARAWAAFEKSLFYGCLLDIFWQNSILYKSRIIRHLFWFPCPARRSRSPSAEYFRLSDYSPQIRKQKLTQTCNWIAFESELVKNLANKINVRHDFWFKKYFLCYFFKILFEWGDKVAD